MVEYDSCTDCGEDLWAPEERELGVCERCLKRIRVEDGRCPKCGDTVCDCDPTK